MQCGHRGLARFYVNRCIFRENMRQKRFPHSHWPWPLTLLPKSCSVSPSWKCECYTMFRFRVRCWHGTDGQTDGRTDGCNAQCGLLGEGGIIKYIDRWRTEYWDAWTSRQNCTETSHCNLVLYRSIVRKGKGKGAYSSSWNSPQNYGTPLVNGITQCYLPPDRGDRPAFTPTGQVGTQFIDPVRMKDWVGLVGWLHTEMVYPSTDGHPSEY